MKRQIIEINHDKCDGCGLCMPECPEGALQMIDGKARLVSDLFCDGLGACLGHCPQGAITTVEREAEAYDEKLVMVNIVKQGENTLIAHLKHLTDHKQDEFLALALEYLNENGIDVPEQFNKKEDKQMSKEFVGCPGSHSQDFTPEASSSVSNDSGVRPSQLTHWPVQMHLISPQAPHFKEADLLLAADCTAFTVGDFHKDYLKDKKVVIACPKLDSGLDIYEDKLKSLIDDAKINTLTVLIMQVPCCGGLIAMAQKVAAEASRKIPIKKIVIGIEGQKLSEEWV